MFYCKDCMEYFFSVEILRHDTSDHPVIVKKQKIDYCPFCGGEVEICGYEKRTIQENR